MKKSVKLAIAMAAFVAATVSSITEAKAQSEVEVDLGADLVSGYVWRGVYQAGSGVSIQPSLGMSYKGLRIGAWGSTSLREGFKELDVTIGYEIGGFSVGVTDYWWAGQGVSFYNHYLDSHLIEGAVGYHFGEAFPLSIEWHTFFAGNLDRDAAGKRKFSTYIQLGYDFSIRSVQFTAAIGVAPWDSPAWLTPHGDKKGFQISNISLTASKEIRITQNYSLPIFVQAIASPATDDAHLVFGLSF